MRRKSASLGSGRKKREGNHPWAWIGPLLVAALLVGAIAVLQVRHDQKARRGTTAGSDGGKRAEGETDVRAGGRGSPTGGSAGEGETEKSGGGRREERGGPLTGPKGPRPAISGGPEVGASGAAAGPTGAPEGPLGPLSPSRPEHGPKAAIIIDDIGWNMDLARSLAGIDLNLTWAVLPHLPYSEESARLAAERGRLREQSETIWGFR